MRYAIGLLAFLAAIPARAQDPAAALGLQRAAASTIAWDVRESNHPSLGDIRFAYTPRPVETAVGSRTVYSRAYFSCQKGIGKLGVELANATAPAAPEGLRPAAEPRLVCHRPTHDGRIETEPLLVGWEVNGVSGDALARGLRAFPLRECASITVRQEVALPAGWRQKTARVEFDIHPYAREMDAIFVACGERSAYAPAEAARPVAVSQLAPAWQSARVIATGRTNVRASPSLQAAIVAQVPPGSLVKVLRTGGEWWRARPASGDGFDGYIREDRLVLP